MRMHEIREISKRIEALLFYTAHPMHIGEVVKVLGCDEGVAINALNYLQKSLRKRGVSLVHHNKTWALTTARHVSDVIQKFTQSEREKDLGNATMEVFAIILYLGPVSRSKIDYIRGVNSAYSVRNLLMRGLIEKEETTHERSHVYKPTIDAVKKLGIQEVSQLKNYSHIKSELEIRAE